jgi:mono/diheme cytochrome c family protein
MIDVRRHLVFALLLASLAGCENGARNMYDQAKYKPQAASDLWRDGRAARSLQPGTVAFSGGDIADTSSGRAERRKAEAAAPAQAGIYSSSALARGRERYDIYCVPCHGAAGDGDGYITRRGFPHPPTFHSDRLRGVADQYLFDVMSRGYGAMYPYADRITQEDRWAIVGYVRALQRAEHASLDDLPVSERAREVKSR